MLHSLRLLVIFLLGTVLGPILLAIIAAALPPKGPQVLTAKEVEVGKLVSAYREKLPSGRLFSSVLLTPDGKECGYEPAKLFPERWESMATDRKSGRFNAYEGYFALHRWRNDNEDLGFIAAVQDQLNANLSRFEAGFLRRCIQSTVISNYCMAKVEAIGEKVERFNSKRQSFGLAEGHEDNVVCLYVDGVAARLGQPLAAPFDQKYANTRRWGY